MKKVATPPTRTRRLSVAEAKATLSDALRRTREAPTVIHNRGHDVAVLIAVDEYERLVANDPTRASAQRFLDDVETLKTRLGGGAELDVPRATLVPRDPFARERR